MSEQLTLYTSKICPFAQRVEIALAEVGAQYTSYEIDLDNKPDWYGEKINSVGKVPAIAYGGPPVPPEHPSPESQKLVESLILLEFVADLYPDSGLLPKDPIQRVKVRFFMDAVSNKLVPGWGMMMYAAQTHERFMEGIKAVQALLPPEGEGKYAVGDTFTIADAAILPFIARGEVACSNDVGTFPVGEGLKAWEEFMNEPEYARIRKYYQDSKGRESFSSTFDAEYAKEYYASHYTNGQSIV